LLEEITLKELLTEDMYAEDTVIGAQMKQTAKAISNNIEDLNKDSMLELLRALEDKEKEDASEDKQCRIVQFASKILVQ